MDQSPDSALGILQFLVANPILLSHASELSYWLLAALAMRLLWAWANKSNATGKVFTLHDALDKVYNDEKSTLPLALVLCCIFIGLAVIAQAFIRG